MTSWIAGAARKRIVVVDDDEAILNLVATRLEIAGHEVHKAKDGFAGFRRILDVRPAAIVLDLNMPLSDGFDLLDRLSRASADVQAPVLVLSAQNADDDVRRAIRMGATDFLAKPFSTTGLLSRVARLLRSAPPVSRTVRQ